MSEFYSPPPTARESATNNDPKPHLPPGWKPFMSTTYPGRIYYWNSITNERIWDLKDILPTGQGPGSPSHGPEAVAVDNRGVVVKKMGVKGEERGCTPSSRNLRNSYAESHNSLISEYERELKEIELIRQRKEREKDRLEEFERIKKREISESNQKAQSLSRKKEGSVHSSESEGSNAPPQKENVCKKYIKDSEGDLADIKKRRENDRLLEQKVKSIKSDVCRKKNSSIEESNVEIKLKEVNRIESKYPPKGRKEKSEREAARQDEPFANVPSFKIPKRDRKLLKVNESFKGSEDRDESRVQKDEHSFKIPKGCIDDENKAEKNNFEDSFDSEKTSEDEEKDDKSWKRTKRKRKLDNDEPRNSKLLKSDSQRSSLNFDGDNRNTPKFHRDKKCPPSAGVFTGPGYSDRESHSLQSRDDTGFPRDNALPRNIPPLLRDNSPLHRDNTLPRNIPPLPRDNSPLPCHNAFNPHGNSIRSLDNSSIPPCTWPRLDNTVHPRDNCSQRHNNDHNKPSNAKVLIAVNNPLHNRISRGHASSSLGHTPSPAVLDDDDHDMDEDGMEAPILTSGLRHKGLEHGENIDPNDCLNYSYGSAEFSIMDDTLNTSKASTEHGSNSNSEAWCPDQDIDRPIDTSLTKELEEEEAMEWEEGPSVIEAVGEAHLARKNLEEGRTNMADGGPGKVMEVAKVNNEGKENNSALMVVIDTCVLMSSLSIVEEIRDNFSMRGRRPLLMIPWTVIRELDSIKDRKDANNKADVSARRAIKWIQAALRARHPQMRQQTIGEESKAEEKFKAEFGDDRILQYCMVLSDDKTVGKVVLFTNDRNLENKALIHGIAAADHENVFNELKNAGNTDNKVEEEIKQDEMTYVHSIMTVVRGVLQHLLEAVLVIEMVEAYGEKMWKDIVKIKPRPSPPYWPLADLFTLFSKHQIAVFSLVYSRDFREVLEEISGFVKKKSCGHKLGETLDFVTKVQRFVDMVDRRGKNLEEVKSAKERLSEMQEEINQMLVHGSTKDDSLEEDGVDQGPVQQLFQNVWAMIYAVCYSLCECFGVPSGLEKSDPYFNLNSAEEASRHISKVFGEVHRLGENLATLLKTAKENRQVDNDQPILVTFLDQLTEFPEFLGVGDSWGPVPKATTRQLLLFIATKSNAEKLDIGLEQLIRFRDLLQKCCQKVEEQN